MVVFIYPRPSQIQFVRVLISNSPAVKKKQIRELKSNTDISIHPEDLASRESLMLSLKLNEVFPIVTVKARNILHERKTKTTFFIANVYHSITEGDLQEEVLNNNAVNFTVQSRAIGQPTNIKDITKESNNQISTAQKLGVDTGWKLYRCEANRKPPQLLQIFNCQKIAHSVRESSNAIRCLRCSQGHSVKEFAVSKKAKY